MAKKDRLGNILRIASLWRCITFTSPLATPKGWRLPMVTEIIHPKSKENEESKGNLTPTDGAGKLLVEGTRKTEWQNPE